MSDQIAINAIRVVDRLRMIDDDYVALLATSIDAIGLQNPITVAEAEEDGASIYRLVAGAHRLCACQSLGWTVIAARVVRGDALSRRLIEIDENLCRRNLSVLDRSRHLAERRNVYEAIHPHSKGRRAGAAKRWHATDIMSVASFAKDAEEKVGLSARHIRRLFLLDLGIAPDVRDRLAITLWADRFSELSRLAKRPRDLQRRIVDELLHPEDPASSVAAAERRIQMIPDTTESQQDGLVRRMCALWGRMGRTEKVSVLARLIETGEFDDLEVAARGDAAKRPRLSLVSGGGAQ